MIGLTKLYLQSTRACVEADTSSRLFCNLTMKAYSFLVTLSLTVVLANAFSTEEHVKRFFRPEHRSLLPEVKSLQLQDEPAVLVPQNDESTKCLAHCEPTCERVDVPDFLTEPKSFHKFEDTPINCVLASTVVFKKKPKYECQFMCLYLFDCCRACNAIHYKCLKEVGYFYGGPEYCYRDNYKCMCDCLKKHNPPENHYKIEEH